MQEPQPPTEADAPYTDTEWVGEHEVVSKTQWVPGDDPAPWISTDPNRGHWERFFCCLRCGAERVSTDQFSADCPGEHTTADESTAGES